MTKQSAELISLTRQCKKCGEIKSASDFSKEKRNKSGFSCTCISCTNFMSRENYKNNKDSVSAKKKKWISENPEKMQKYRDNWDARNPEKRKLIRNQARKFAPKERTKHQSLKYKYGITLDMFMAIYHAQNGECAICKKEVGKFCKKTCVDHNHATGAVRGILCTACNFAIGALGEKEENLLSAISYLSKYRCD